MEPQITWYAQSAVRIDAAGLRIYVDPYHLPDGQPRADVLLVSHHHGDHLSADDIAKVRGPETAVFANPTAAERLNPPVTILTPGMSAEHSGLKIRTIPAHNVDKFRSEGVPFHPPAEQHLGYILEIDELSYYFSGDTDIIPEMETVGPVDYAFLPVSGRAVMTAEEAARAASIVQPSVAVPVHYGAGLGTVEDARRFAEAVPDQVRVWIMTPEGDIPS